MRCSIPILFLALSSGSCRPAPAAAAQADHGHEHAESVQFTRWRKGFELFCEYAIPVRGEAVAFIVHVSDTRTDEPRRSGAATLRLTAPDGSRSEVSEESPAHDGMYLPRVTFDAVGDWRVELVLRSEGVGADVELSFPTVRVYADEQDAAHADVPHPPDGIGFTKEQQWRLGTRIAPVEEKTLVRRIQVPGVVHAAQERQAIVSPPVSGRLDSADGKAFPHLGTRVAQGQVLGYVRPPFSDYMARLQEAEAEIVRAQLAVERTQLVLERATQLHARQARTDAELEKAHFDEQLALSDYTAAKSIAEALRASGIETSEQGDVRFALRSPIAGIVVEVEAVNGSFAEAGTHLIHVRDSSFVHLEAMIRPAVLDALSDSELPLFVRARGTQAGGDSRIMDLPGAKLAFVGDEVDPHTLSVPVHFEVENPGNRLRIGELIELEFSIGDPAPRLALPASAVVEEDGVDVVFVQLAGEVFERRYPQLGFRDGDYVEVKAGLEAGDRVVFHRAYAVRLASVSGDAPGHGHAH